MFQFPRFPPDPYTFRARSQVSLLGDCSIRAPPARRVGAAPRGVSPRPRALHRPRRPRHPPRAHPCDAPSPATTARRSRGARVGPHRGTATLAPVGHPHLPTDGPHRSGILHCQGPPPMGWPSDRGAAWRCGTDRSRWPPGSSGGAPLRPPPPPGEGGGIVGLLSPAGRPVRTPIDSTWDGGAAPGGRPRVLPRKEVIQPQLPLRLPCYDFVPVTRPTLGRCPLAVGPRTSGVAGSHDVTGGVYKAREQIHRSMADLRLLATPTSRGRVAAPDPNWDRVSGIGSTSRLRTPLSRPL